MTLERLLAMVQGLQGDMENSRARQGRMQVDLDASEARNAELQRVNEELRRAVRNNRGGREAETEPLTPPREFSTPFSQEILDAVVPVPSG